MRRTDQQSDRDREGLLYRRGGRTVEDYPGCDGRDGWGMEDGWRGKMGGKGWMDKRTRRRENCAPLLISLSNECVASKCQAFTPTSIVLHSPSSFSHAHAYLHSPHIRTSTSTPYIIRILHMQAQVGQAWTLCVVWFTVRRARFFLGSTLRPLLPLFCPRRPMWHLLQQFSTLFRHSQCILHLTTFCITNISLCMDDLYSFTVDIVQCLLGRLQCYILYKCQAETTRSSLTSCSYYSSSSLFIR